MIDKARRFGGIERLYGEQALARLAQARVLVAGIGGVGSWAAEALARCGVGHLVLVDLDHVAESNINRQIHALESTVGAAKTQVMAERIRLINPDCGVRCFEDFLTVDNLDTIIGTDVDFVIDAIDQPRVKAALIAWCRDRATPMIVCGAAGGRTDPLSLAREDVALVRGDALLSSVRARLRRDFEFAREAGRRFGVSAIYSRQPRGGAVRDDSAGSALACSGYGSIVTVTASMGLAAAQAALETLLRTGSPVRPVAGGRVPAQ